MIVYNYSLFIVIESNHWSFGVCVHMVQCIVFLLIRWRLNIIDLGRVHCTLNSIDDIGQIFVHSIRCLFFSSLFHLDVIHFTPSRRRSLGADANHIVSLANNRVSFAIALSDCSLPLSPSPSWWMEKFSNKCHCDHYTEYNETYFIGIRIDSFSVWVCDCWFSNKFNWSWSEEYKKDGGVYVCVLCLLFLCSVVWPRIHCATHCPVINLLLAGISVFFHLFIHPLFIIIIFIVAINRID